MKIHQRHNLKSKDVKILIKKLTESFGKQNISTIIEKKSRVEWIKLDNREELISVNGTLCFWLNDKQYLPLMSMLINKEIKFEMPSILVDAGAIPYVTKGADVMRPGITKIDSNILKDDIIIIRDFKHKRALAVGMAKFNADEMESMNKGKVIQNLHTISDDIWKFSKQF